jgi:peptide deformylase
MKLLTDADDLTTLKTLCEDFDFDNPPFDAHVVGKEMIAFMYEKGGIGLAANQIGLKHRMFVMRGHPDRGDFIIINPRIVNTSQEWVLLEESCLSFPGLIVKIKRPRHCRIRFQVVGGGIFTEQFTGITARCVQHEIDHLNGHLFYQRANKYYRDVAFRNRGKHVQKDTRFPKKIPIEV